MMMIVRYEPSVGVLSLNLSTLDVSWMATYHDTQKEGFTSHGSSDKPNVVIWGITDRKRSITNSCLETYLKPDPSEPLGRAGNAVEDRGEEEGSVLPTSLG